MWTWLIGYSMKGKRTSLTSPKMLRDSQNNISLSYLRMVYVLVKYFRAYNLILSSFLTSDSWFWGTQLLGHFANWPHTWACSLKWVDTKPNLESQTKSWYIPGAKFPSINNNTNSKPNRFPRVLVNYAEIRRTVLENYFMLPFSP